MCFLVGKQPGGVHDKGTGADRQNCLAVSRLRRNEIEKDRVADFQSRALTTGDQQVVERRAVREGNLRVDGQAISTHDRIKCLPNDQAVGRTVSELAPHREHFPRTHKVEFFDLIEDNDTEVHGKPFLQPGCHLRWPAAPQRRHYNWAHLTSQLLGRLNPSYCGQHHSRYQTRCTATLSHAAK